MFLKRKYYWLYFQAWYWVWYSQYTFFFPLEPIVEIKVESSISVAPGYKGTPILTACIKKEDRPFEEREFQVNAFEIFCSTSIFMF